MPAPILRLASARPKEVDKALRKLADELEIDREYPAAPAAEAREVAEAVESDPDGQLADLLDRTAIPFVTIDPEGSRDLDQAVCIEREGDGYLVYYAIAALTRFVRPGGALDREVHHRAVTVYGPSESYPLHPLSLSAGAASLLPGVDRPAYVWYLHLNADGRLRHSWVEMARVRSRAQLTYEQVHHALQSGGPLPSTPPDLPGLLEEVGKLRLAIEKERGGVSLSLPEQEIVTGQRGYRLAFRTTMPVEDYNAQISLLTGMAAADMMIYGGVGILRTLPPASKRDLNRLRRTARALGIKWQKHESYSEVLSRMDSSISAHAAFLNEATTLFRGAGYQAFGTEEIDDDHSSHSHDDAEVANDDADHASPSRGPGRGRGRHSEESNEPRKHNAIAAHYAHVTAPLRRLVDRYGLEICRCMCAEEEIPDWILRALPTLPEEMDEGTHRAKSYENGALDIVEALILQGGEGTEFTADVVDIAPARRRAADGTTSATIMIAEPAIRTRIRGKSEDLELGSRIRVRLDKVKIKKRELQFSVLETAPSQK